LPFAGVVGIIRAVVGATVSAAVGSRDLYDAFIAAHVICAVVGFGSLAISGVYGFTSRHPAGPDAVDEARRYFRAPGHLELAVLAVPFLGVAALAVQPAGRGVGQLWALVALGVWAVAAAVLVGVVRPAERRLRMALAGADPDGAELACAGVVTDVTFLVALLLMVFQPR
jgi:uncharacterized membrane protein